MNAVNYFLFIIIVYIITYAYTLLVFSIIYVMFINTIYTYVFCPATRSLCRPTPTPPPWCARQGTTSRRQTHAPQASPASQAKTTTVITTEMRRYC